jgi:hypothetical protein
LVGGRETAYRWREAVGRGWETVLEEGRQLEEGRRK